MINLQLFINNRRVDLYDNETLQINDQIQNSKSFASLFSGYSENYTLPATNNNNEIFKHYYNYELDNGFDASIRQRALIKINGIDKYFGYVQLQSVSLKDNKAKDYKIIFTSFISILKQRIKDDTLRNVYNLIDLGYKYSGITNQNPLRSNLCFTTKDPVTGERLLSTTTDFNEAVICKPLIFSENYAYDGNNFIDENGINLSTVSKYEAVSVRAILYKIFDYYGLDVDAPFFNSTPFNELFIYAMPSDTEELPPEIFLDDYYLTSNELTLNSGSNVFDSNGLLNVSDDETKTVRVYINTNNDLDRKVNVIIRDRLSGQELLNEDITNNTFVDPTDNITIRNGVFTSLKLKGARQYDLQIIASTRLIFEEFTYIRVDDSLYNAEVATKVSRNIRNLLPPLSVIDFIDSVFKLYNLTAFEKPNGQIRIEPLDDFYDNGRTVDLTKFIDISRSTIKRVEGFSDINFEYKKAKTAAIELQNAISIGGYGNLKYKEKTSVNTNKYSVKPVFNLILPERLDTSGNDDVIVARNIDKDGKEIFNEGLIFYIKPRTSDKTGITNLTDYNSVSNVASDDSTLFYGIENDVDGNEKDSSLFINHFANYVNSVYDKKSRIYEVDAYLPLDYIQEYELNDNVIINNRAFRIENLKVNVNTGKSKLSLNNVPQISNEINLFLTAFPSGRRFQSPAFSFNLNISSNTSWQIINTAPWITFSQTSGFGTTLISVSITENTGSDRSEVVLISGQGVSTIEYAIVQLATAPPSELTVTPNTSSIDFNSQNIPITITSNLEWNFSVSDNWINPPIIFPQEGNASVNVSVDQNNSASSRIGTLTVAADDGSVSDTLTITQGAFSTPTTYQKTLGFGSSSGDACSQIFTGTYYINNISLTSSSKIWTDSSGSTLAPANFYSDGSNWVEFNGTVVISSGNC